MRADIIQNTGFLLGVREAGHKLTLRWVEEGSAKPTGLIDFETVERDQTLKVLHEEHYLVRCQLDVCLSSAVDVAVMCRSLQAPTACVQLASGVVLPIKSESVGSAPGPGEGGEGMSLAQAVAMSCELALPGKLKSSGGGVGAAGGGRKGGGKGKKKAGGKKRGGGGGNHAASLLDLVDDAAGDGGVAGTGGAVVSTTMGDVVPIAFLCSMARTDRMEYGAGDQKGGEGGAFDCFPLRGGESGGESKTGGGGGAAEASAASVCVSQTGGSPAQLVHVDVLVYARRDEPAVVVWRRTASAACRQLQVLAALLRDGVERQATGEEVPWAMHFAPQVGQGRAVQW